MTNEERDLITQFIQRVAGAPVPAPAYAAPGSVPRTIPATQPLPPIDREADALIADLMQRHPEARYRLTQTAFVQEHALAEAQNTINRLQWERDQARAQAAPPAPAASPWGAAAQPQRGLIGSLFGGRQGPSPQAAAPQAMAGQSAPPPPMHAPGYQPGMFQQQQQGPSFLSSALTTAAGVAGGMVVGNMLMNAFSGGGAAHAATPPATPWTNATSAPDPYAQGGDPKDGGWQQASPVSYQNNEDQGDSGWSDAGSDEEL